MAHINTTVAFTEVTGDNINQLMDPILDTIRQAQYIAVDTEFSGHCPTIAKHMEQRYHSMAQVIRTHTLFSFGLTVISTQQTNYQFTNFEFLARNQDTFHVDPNNIKFLAENGLDFARIFANGIPFSNNNDKPDALQQLWHGILHIIKDRSIPIIVHNGLLDIMYLYQSFFATLPTTLSTLVEDLVDMFPAGIYDTKYVAVSVLGESKSFLAYLYCKYRRLASWHGQVLPPLSPTTKHDDDDIQTPAMKRRKRAKKGDTNKDGICGSYSQNGWCKRGKACPLSHDLDIILDHDLGMIPKDINELEQVSTTRKDQQDIKQHTGRRDHSAHFDAYMTAFIFCHFLTTCPDLPLHINKLNLMRLDIPLHLKQSHYSKPSTEWTRIKSQLWPSL
ncbi:ribonuclease CAF1 [Chlamydoabsidia padenii]|nr:ribonuclease CAF1 [Chlamydoabsidia padenii]